MRRDLVVILVLLVISRTCHKKPRINKEGDKLKQRVERRTLCNPAQGTSESARETRGCNSSPITEINYGKMCAHKNTGGEKIAN